VTIQLVGEHDIHTLGDMESHLESGKTLTVRKEFLTEIKEK
jgi:hypothetical protein